MATFYLESSAFIKRYKISETGSAYVNSLFSEENRLFCLDLSRIELEKAFFRLAYFPENPSDKIVLDSLRMISDQIKADFGKVELISTSDILISKALNNVKELCEEKKTWLKSVFDLMHLTAYLFIREEYPKTKFVCSDFRTYLIQAAISYVGENEVIIPK